MRSVATAGYKENLRAIVFKDLELGSFGFSVSDGVDEQGVFVNSIKPDGPAARAGVLPFDRILQINNIRYFSFRIQLLHELFLGVTK